MLPCSTRLVTCQYSSCDMRHSSRRHTCNLRDEERQANANRSKISIFALFGCKHQDCVYELDCQEHFQEYTYTRVSLAQQPFHASLALCRTDARGQCSSEVCCRSWKNSACNSGRCHASENLSGNVEEQSDPWHISRDDQCESDTTES